jgi:hypothetical protein
MALAAVTNDGYRLAFDQAQITIFIVKNFHRSLRCKKHLRKRAVIAGLTRNPWIPDRVQDDNQVLSR